MDFRYFLLGLDLNAPINNYMRDRLHYLFKGIHCFIHNPRMFSP